MKSKQHIPNNRFAQLVFVLLMCFCLLFLTGVNFILYNSNFKADIAAVQNTNTTEDEPTPAPVEERSSASVNILEELLHENHFPKIIAYLDALSNHQVHEAAKLEVVHFQLISPPPDSSSC